MTKIEIDIPDNIIKFIKISQKYYLLKENVEGYVKKAVYSICEADLEGIHSENPKKAKKLMRDLRLGDIAMSPWCYPPEDLVVNPKNL